MIINFDLVETIRETWIRDQEHPYKDREKRNIPDQNRLADLLDVAFRVSLDEEEGTPVRGSLVFLSSSDIDASEIPRRRESPLLLRLIEPRDLEPEVLRKLAPTTVGGGASLLVDWFGDRPKVWGVIYSGKRQGLLSEVAAGIPEARHFLPDALTIEIVGPGSLVISRGGSVVGRIHKGEFEKALPTPFHSRAMGPILYDLFAIRIANGKFIDAEEDGFRSQTLFACLDYLLFKLAKRGSGACIIFIPNSSISTARQTAQFPWDCEGGLEMEALMLARIRYATNERAGRSPSLFTQKASEALRQRLDHIASLALIDGATLLTPAFDVIGFGAKLMAPKFNGLVVEGENDVDERSGRQIDFSRFGTRHNSALWFIAAVPGSVGFVASADGPIRGLTRRDEESLWCWQDCRTSMFVGP